jgi:mannose-6-phosphate isomerase-like protein (cupin superfamily)
VRLIKREKDSYHLAEKSWGYEVWIENNDEYCGKELVFYSGGESSCTSMHFHVLKRETMYCASGSFRIDYIDTSSGKTESIRLFTGESVEIPRLTPHKIVCTVAGRLLEFSTPHSDDDSHRLSQHMVTE